MSSIKTLLLITSMAATACDAMHLNFKSIYEYMGKGQGKTAMRKQLKEQDADMLQPLLDKLNNSAEIITQNPNGDMASETKTIFEGFVWGYAAGLLQHSEYNKDKVFFDTEAFNGKFDTEKEQNKSRKELVTFLTAIFTKAELISSN